MFEKNDTIVFLGDSITAAALWINEIYDYFKDNMPEKKIKIYNSGNPGDSAWQAYKRINYDCLTHNPQLVNILIGINDIDRGMYSPDCADPDKEEKRKKAMAKHKEYIEKLVVKSLDAGAEVVLCTLTPYDEVSDTDAENLMCTPGVEECNKFKYELAERYNLKIVDFYSNMKPMLGTEGLMRPDRVHPEPKGYHAMAQIWMKEMGLIEKPDFESEYKMSEKMEKLYKLSDIERNIRFTEYHDIPDYLDKPIAERIKATKEKIAMYRSEGTDWRAENLENYVKYAEYTDKLHSGIFDAMMEMYK